MVRNKISKIEQSNLGTSSLLSSEKFKETQRAPLHKKSMDTNQELLAVTRKMATLQMELHQLKKSYALVELLLEEQTKSLAALREELPAWEGCYAALERVLHGLLRALERLQEIPSCGYITAHHLTVSEGSQGRVTQS